MNAGVISAAVGVVSLLVGMAGLFYPEKVMALVGFSALDPAHAAAARGEIRAVYGGVFMVMGVYALVAASRPAAYKSLLLCVGFLWLGAFTGRAIGIYLDGNPGLLAWVALGLELVIGGSLLAAALPGVPARDAVSPSRSSS